MVQSTQMSILPSVTPALRREALAATVLHPELEPWQGVLVEAWLTFILLCTIQGATNARRKGSVYMPTIIIGCAVTVGVMSGVRMELFVVMYFFFICLLGNRCICFVLTDSFYMMRLYGLSLSRMHWAMRHSKL